MNNLPTAILNKIIEFKNGDVIFWKHNFNLVIQSIRDDVYIYGECPKCRKNCDNDMPCWLDTFLQLKCDPEWVMTYGFLFNKNNNDYKHYWYKLWKTGSYVSLKNDRGYYGWLDDLDSLDGNLDYSDNSE